eukprot:COSAG06_NODE_8654_length_2105_cov_7.917877_2_plen_41_part_01
MQWNKAILQRKSSEQVRISANVISLKGRLHVVGQFQRAVYR